MLAVFLPFGVVYWIQEWVKVLSWAERQEVWRYLSLLVLPGVGPTFRTESHITRKRQWQHHPQGWSLLETDGKACFVGFFKAHEQLFSEGQRLC